MPNDPEATYGAGAEDAAAPTIYCPYTDRDIPLSESSPEHIIPLALGGMNGFAIPVSKDSTLILVLRSTELLPTTFS